MRNEGFTLIEAMIATAVLTTVSLGLYDINLAMTKSAVAQEHRTLLQDEGRQALQYMARRMRMADAGSIVTVATTGSPTTTFGQASTDNITFQTVGDIDGNGLAINVDFSVGLQPAITFALDINDANGDGIAEHQLVEMDAQGNITRVLCSHVADGGGFRLSRASGGILMNLVLVHEGGGTVSPSVVRMFKLVTTRN